MPSSNTELGKLQTYKIQQEKEKRLRNQLLSCTKKVAVTQVRSNFK